MNFRNGTEYRLLLLQTFVKKALQDWNMEVNYTQNSYNTNSTKFTLSFLFTRVVSTKKYKMHNY